MKFVALQVVRKDSDRPISILVVSMAELIGTRVDVDVLDVDEYKNIAILLVDSVEFSKPLDRESAERIIETMRVPAFHFGLESCAGND